MYPSTTQDIPETQSVPQHIAIIMDGNGRWAQKRHLPRFAGHRKGVEALRGITAACVKQGVRYLTLFAFSSENWRRPADEVGLLMDLFTSALTQEVDKLHANDIRVKVVGDTARFGTKLEALIDQAQAKTQHNQGLTLTIAANYGGRWDMLRAVNAAIQHQTSKSKNELTEADLQPYLAMHFAPEPDLFIRTGGEQRISNFLLWQLAYTELYFTETLWPDFDAAALEQAIGWYSARERRFGRTSEQLNTAKPHA
jgi:undecaprenyl diphosphate synthase